MTGMIEWRQKSKPKKVPGPNFAPKKSHAEFPSHKNFQKALNDITQKIEKLVIWSVCVCLFITPSGVRTFFASGGHKTAAKQVWFDFIAGTTRPRYTGTITNLQIVLNT